MNDDYLESLLDRILCKKLLVFYKNEKYELIQPTFEIKYEADLIYENIINDEKFNDWIRQYDLVETLIFCGLWTKDTMKIIKSLETKIDDQKVDLFKSALFVDKEKKARKALLLSKTQLNTILSKKQDFLTHTLEGYASSIKNEHIICETLLKNNKKVFNTKLSGSSSSYVLFNDIVNEINKFTIQIESFKKLARSHMWRSYWTSAKNGASLFVGSVSEWSDDQRVLASMSRMYDNVYEHPECPSDQVIEDDDMLDGWMILQRRLVDVQKKKAAVDALHPKLRNAQEVFIMANDSQEAQEIKSFNTQETLNTINQRSDFINARGSVSSIELPDVQMDLRNKMAEQMKASKK